MEDNWKADWDEQGTCENQTAIENTPLERRGKCLGQRI